MSLIFSEEQEMIRDMAAKFAADKLAPHSEAWDRDSHFPVDVIRSTAELGFAGIYNISRLSYDADRRRGMSLLPPETYVTSLCSVGPEIMASPVSPPSYARHLAP